MRKLLVASLTILALACGEDLQPVNSASCSLKRVPAINAIEMEDDSALKRVSYTVSSVEDLFDNERRYWGTILPHQERITFRNATELLLEVDGGV